MILGRKAQSTAEYAIVIGLIVAIAAGILGVTLKGGIRQRQQQGVKYLLGAGYNTLNAEIAAQGSGVPDAELFTQEIRKTEVAADDYLDESVMEKGGLTKQRQRQTTESSSLTVETLNATE